MSEQEQSATRRIVFRSFVGVLALLVAVGIVAAVDVNDWSAGALGGALTLIGVVAADIGYYRRYKV